MAEGGSGNIFDEASRQSKKKFLKKKPEEPAPLVASKPDDTPSLTDVKSMFQKMREMREKLQAQMLDVYSKTGKERDEIESFMRNPTGISPEIQEQLDRQLKNVEAKVRNALGKKSTAGAKLVKEKKEELKRKKKFIGKRRNWLEM